MAKMISQPAGGRPEAADHISSTSTSPDDEGLRCGLGQGDRSDGANWAPHRSDNLERPCGGQRDVNPATKQGTHRHLEHALPKPEHPIADDGS